MYFPFPSAMKTLLPGHGRETRRQASSRRLTGWWRRCVVEFAVTVAAHTEVPCNRSGSDTCASLLPCCTCLRADSSLACIPPPRTHHLWRESCYCYRYHWTSSPCALSCFVYCRRRWLGASTTARLKVSYTPSPPLPFTIHGAAECWGRTLKVWPW